VLVCDYMSALRVQPFRPLRRKRFPIRRQSLQKLVNLLLNLHSSVITDWKRGSFYSPVFRKHRHLRSYNAAAANRSLDEQKDWHCFRKPSRDSGLTSGVLCIFCPCGICHGFSLLRNAESESDAFQLFVTRCETRTRPRSVMYCSFVLWTAPGMIVYDRCCKFHTYCLKREAAFFYNCIFRIDITHFKNHTACSEGYNPAVYRALNVQSSKKVGPWANTEVAEQCFATLKRLRTACAATTQQHGQELIRTFLAFRNLQLLNR
jgi:hypothetical protein